MIVVLSLSVSNWCSQTWLFLFLKWFSKFHKFLCLSQARTWILNVICRGLFCVQWGQVRWEVFVWFVDIGGIDDHHCLNFLFIIIVWFRFMVFNSNFNNISNISNSQLLWWTALIAQVVVNPTTIRSWPRRPPKY